MNNFDIGIVGAGVAGAFATLKIAQTNKNAKTIVFDIGRPPMKRRRQLEGWLGCLPNSDGKLYLNNVHKVSELTGTKKSKTAYNTVHDTLSNISKLSVVKDKSPSISMEKKLKKIGFNTVLNDFIQIYPKDIHGLSKQMSEMIEESQSQITFSFDNEVKSIHKQKNHFIVSTEYGEFTCNKLIIAVGRSGWRWAKNLYNNFGIIENNDLSQFGIRVEISSSYMKDFNKSACSLIKNDIEIGPFSWNGTVIPEDHVDLAISSFRSNENRWKTDKVSFALIGNRPFTNNGIDQTDRIGKLTFVLSDDRVIKEKISTLLSGKSKISVISEYDWLIPALEEFSVAVPDVLTKGYFHVPTILPTIPKINISNNLETDIEGMFVAGESAGIHGILGAAISGCIAAESVCR